MTQTNTNQQDMERSVDTGDDGMVCGTFPTRFVNPSTRATMTIARAHLVDPSVSRGYHCITRCVRQACLLGASPNDRKVWIESRPQELLGVFSVAIRGPRNWSHIGGAPEHFEDAVYRTVTGGGISCGRRSVNRRRTCRAWPSTCCPILLRSDRPTPFSSMIAWLSRLGILRHGNSQPASWRRSPCA
jgi:hypothetical protein